MDADRYIEVYGKHYFHSFEMFYLNVDLCKTMHQCTRQERRNTSLESEGINWRKTPPESPDCNPTENVWHELKEYIRREAKPTTKQELVDGIRRFWATVTVEKCCSYVSHLRKVVPKVKGAATGF